MQELRLAAAAAHGLPARAATLLDGDTVEEIEAQAERLAALVAKHNPNPEPRTVFEFGRVQKEARRRSLIDALSGHPQQLRDEPGRFAAGAGGFDGGARPLAPAEPLTHEQVLAEALRTGSHDVGANL
jgi:hypothetical protein